LGHSSTVFAWVVQWIIKTPSLTKSLGISYFLITTMAGTGDDYLLEAKWQKAENVNAGELYKFAGKINGKRKNTLGLFISIDGFSKESTLTTSSDLRSLILMDGMDLDAVLTDRIKLDDLLYRKRRHASETGNIYLSVNKILVS
jgi:hypothetical protein